jgi:D-alanine--poly(phosphoribitol) ligase subunit 1
VTPLAQSFLNTTSRFGKRTALWVDDQYYSYDALHQLASGLASGLTASMSNREENVNHTCAIFAHRSVIAYEGILACHLARHAYVALTPKLPIGRLRSILHQSKPTSIIVDSRCLQALPDLLEGVVGRMNILLPDQNIVPDWANQFPHHLFLNKHDLTQPPTFPDGNGQDLAYLMYTSGSTGEPKGVMVTHDNVMTYARNVVQYFGYNSDDRFIHLPELNFDLSVHDLFSAWAVGASLYCVPQDEVLMPDGFVRRNQLTAWTSVPSAAAMLKRFNKLRPGVFDCLRVSMFCGEPFPGTLASEWSAAAPNSRVDNLYGPTETTVAVTAYPCSRGTDFAVLPLGEPFADQEIAICDAELNNVRDGDIGELLLGGSQVTNGYWKLPDLTDAQFIRKKFPNRLSDRWYRTGDLACNQAGVGLVYKGRENRQIKIHGYRVELAEIEAVLRQKSGREFVAVVPTLGEGGRTLYLSAFVEGLMDDDQEMLNRECLHHLPNYMMPRYIFSIDRMPFTPNGKIDYITLENINEQRVKNKI